MKKLIISLLLTVSCFGAQAQSTKREVAFVDQHIEKRGEQVFVSFRVEAGRRSVRSGETLVLAPVLTDGNSKWSLPEVVVRRARARIATMRHDWADGVQTPPPAWDTAAVIVKAGRTAYYEAVFDWQPWMHGADLVAERLTMSCCSARMQEGMLLLADAQLPPPVVAVPEPEPEPVPEPVQTTAELLAAGRPYIVPYSDFKGLEKGLLDEDRDKSGTVYYRFDRYDIDRTYRDNSRSLDDIVASVRTIQASSDSRVRMIVVAGFTSPEGRLALNNRLGSNRGASVKKYIMEQTGLPDEAIRVYNGSEDWQGLRMLVERSDMPSKERVLDIIVNMPIWDAATKHGREGELMRLDGGNPWRYMRKHFFPDLRNAAYIKVYYENK